MYQTHEALLFGRRQSFPFLIAAHRGIPSSGSVVQNTLLAARTALLEGADIVELDLAQSEDGGYFAFHTGFERSLLDTGCALSQMSSREIEGTGYRNEVQNRLHHGPERMEQLLLALKGTCLLNIDRAWLGTDFDHVLGWLESLHMEDQVVVKTPVEEPFLSVMERHACLYMPILRDVRQWKAVQPRAVNIVAAECQWREQDSPLARRDFIEELHRAHVLAWANALRLSDDFTLSAWADDYVSLSSGPEQGWGILVRVGFDIIQTDFPGLLSKWRNQW